MPVDGFEAEPQECEWCNDPNWIRQSCHWHTPKEGGGCYPPIKYCTSHQNDRVQKLLDGSELISFERKRQVSAEGWTPEHDATHGDSSLVMAAICYASCAALDPAYTVRHENNHASKHFTFRDPWPWEKSADKRPTGTPSREQQVRLLVKAGALIAAEIDRLRGAK